MFLRLRGGSAFTAFGNVAPTAALHHKVHARKRIFQARGRGDAKMPIAPHQPNTAPKRSALSDLADAGQRLIDIWWVSYALIAALQLKILWNIWRYRDLTPGDTSSYFLDAARWARRLEVLISAEN
jgi:hypothetical protein